MPVLELPVESPAKSASDRAREAPRPSDLLAAEREALSKHFGTARALVLGLRAGHWLDAVNDGPRTHAITDSGGQPVARVTDPVRGWTGALARLLLGSRRRLNVTVASGANETLLQVHREPSLGTTHAEVLTGTGRRLGCVERRSGLTHVRLHLQDALGRTFGRVTSPAWKPRTFTVRDASGWESARITRPGSRFLQRVDPGDGELVVDFGETDRPLAERCTLLATAIVLGLDLFSHDRRSSR